MTDATTQSHRHAHDHAGESRGDAPSLHLRQAPAAQARDLRESGASLLEASAGARLLWVSLLVALLWAGVYWALH